VPALASAKAGVEHKLPLVDSIVYATAQSVGGVVWTQDADFDCLSGVEYHPRRVGKS
jgi:predicted nuclease of predicted toxin-antitoxin system